MAELREDQKLWIEAEYLVDRYGNDSFYLIVKRLEELASTKNHAAIRRWKGISTRVSKLIGGTLH